MNVDSRSTKTYLQMKHKKCLIDQKLLKNGPETILPDNTKIQASGQGTLPLHPALSTTALIFPHLQNESLLLFGQLCDEGCITIFNKTYLSILKDKKIIMKGTRNLTDGL